MFKDKYSITDIVTMTRLSDRTIRTYIKKGLLAGEKLNGVWLFSDEDINKFLNEKYVKYSIKIKNNAMVNDFIINEKKRNASICSIYDYPVQNEREAEIICKKILSQIDNNKYNDIDMSYNFDSLSKMIRLIVIGYPHDVISFMENLSFEVY